MSAITSRCPATPIEDVTVDTSMCLIMYSKLQSRTASKTPINPIINQKLVYTRGHTHARDIILPSLQVFLVVSFLQIFLLKSCIHSSSLHDCLSHSRRKSESFQRFRECCQPLSSAQRHTKRLNKARAGQATQFPHAQFPRPYKRGGSVGGFRGG